MLKVPRTRRTRTFALFALGLIAQVVIVGAAVQGRADNCPAGPAGPSVSACDAAAHCIAMILGCNRQQVAVEVTGTNTALGDSLSVLLSAGGEHRALHMNMGFLANPGVAEFVAITPSAGCTVAPTEIMCQLTGSDRREPRRAVLRTLRTGSATYFVDISADGGDPVGADVTFRSQVTPSPSEPFTMTVTAPMTALAPYDVMFSTQSPTPILNFQGSAELFTQAPAPPGSYGLISITPPGTVNRLSPHLVDFGFTQGVSGTATFVDVAVRVVPSVGPLTVAVPTLHYSALQVQADGAGPVTVYAPTRIVSNGVTIVATDATATEAGLTTGTFTVRRTGNSAEALTVFYTVAGTATPGSDYATLAGSVIIPPGALSANITITPRADLVTEQAETVVVTLAARPTYTVGTPSSATVSVTSGTSTPVVTVVAADPTATEAGLTTGAFTVRRAVLTTAPLTVFYTLTGTAARGTDYSITPAPVGSVTIPAGALSATVVVKALDDSLMEGAETVILTLAARPTYTLGTQRSATVNISSNEVVTVVAMDPTATEAGRTPGTFKVSRTGSTTALTVFYTVGGTATRTGTGVDYATLSGSVVIPAGQTFALVTVTPNDDPLMEGSETVVLTLAPRPNYTVGAPSSATVRIISNEVVTVMATDPTATEAGNTTGRFTVRRTGLLTPLTVFYTLGGTAVRGSDYVITPPPPVAGRVVIPAGVPSVTLTVTPNNDALSESNETVVLALIPQPTYTVGPPSIATVTISSNE